MASMYRNKTLIGLLNKILTQENQNSDRLGSISDFYVSTLIIIEESTYITRVNGRILISFECILNLITNPKIEHPKSP